MTIRAERDSDITQAFALTAIELSRVHELLERRVGPVGYSAECRDKLKRTFPTLESLLEYENAPSRSIETLRISATSADRQTTVRLRFSPKDEGNVFIGIAGEESVVLALSDSLNERVGAIRPWYHLAARLRAGVLLWTAYVAYAVVWPLMSWVVGWIVAGRPPAQLSESNNGSMLFIAVGLLMGFAIIFASGLLNRLRRMVFPMAVFRIGQGSARDRDAELLRKGVVLSFVVSVAAGAVLLPFA